MKFNASKLQVHYGGNKNKSHYLTSDNTMVEIATTHETYDQLWQTGQTGPESPNCSLIADFYMLHPMKLGDRRTSNYDDSTEQLIFEKIRLCVTTLVSKLTQSYR